MLKNYLDFGEADTIDDKISVPLVNKLLLMTIFHYYSLYYLLSNTKSFAGLKSIYNKYQQYSDSVSWFPVYEKLANSDDVLALEALSSLRYYHNLINSSAPAMEIHIKRKYKIDKWYTI